MTPHGLRFVIERLKLAEDMPALKRVWESLGIDYQRDPRAQAVKNQRKAVLHG